MRVPFKKRPTESHWKRRSLSFSEQEVSKVSFEDEVEIQVYNQDNKILETVLLDGFVFINSVKKRKLSERLNFYTITV